VNAADGVRDYCKATYVDPARATGQKIVKIRVGDVHSSMRFNNRLPLVCSALGSNKFEQLGRVKRISVDGPLNGANTVFTFMRVDSGFNTSTLLDHITELWGLKIDDIQAFLDAARSKMPAPKS